jgi:predicted DNA-binding protein with PD1-like motif
MQHTNDNRRHTIVLARGEELIASLTALCEREGIKNAVFQGIGAVENAEIGYYSLAKREYFFQKPEGEYEVASMQGNIALVEGKPFVHAHAVLSRCDESGAIVAGHLKSAVVAVTLEISLTVLDSAFERKLDDAIGLKLLSL